MLSVLILEVYVSAGVFAGPLSASLLPLALVALAGMMVESLPFKDVDNITLTLAAVLVGLLVF